MTEDLSSYHSPITGLFPAPAQMGELSCTRCHSNVGHYTHGN